MTFWIVLPAAGLSGIVLQVLMRTVNAVSLIAMVTPRPETGTPPLLLKRSISKRECGSGLCQQLAGDFLFHCHVAHHYVSGMWGYWRVYNTLQQGDMRNDVMPDLRELPDRKNRIRAPVTSDKLVGQTVEWFGKTFQIVDKGKSNWKGNPAVINIKDWVTMQLPTSGKPGHKDDEKGQIQSYDATVLDWVWEGNRAMSEKESTMDNPKYKSTHPGKRHPITFETTDRQGGLAAFDPSLR